MADEIEPPQKRRNYTMSFKIEVIGYEEKSNNSDASRKFNVDVRRIREWRKQKCEIQKMVNETLKGEARKKIVGGGRKAFDEELEEVVLDWIFSRRANGLRVSRKLIRYKAKNIYNDKNPEENDKFMASPGWVDKFMARHGLSLRRKTVAQKDPEQLIDKLVGYVLHIRRFCMKYNYLPSSIIAMDETPVWNNMVSDVTVEKSGKKTISMKTTGHEKVLVSVCLAARADGRKLKPLIVFRGAKREVKTLNEQFKQKCIISTSSNAWTNEELTLVWVKQILGTFSFNRRLLAWDAFSCHLMSTVKEELSKIAVDQVIVPGGCTKYIQAPDICGNRPFKMYVTEE